MMEIDAWTLLRTNLKTLDEHIEAVDLIRLQTGLDAYFCPMLDFLKSCPNETITDVLRAEIFLNVHPKWGSSWCHTAILYAGLSYDKITTAAMQLNCVKCILTMPKELVFKDIQNLLSNPALKFESNEAMELIVDFLLENHKNPKAFFAQEHILKHVPSHIDLTSASAPDHPHLLGATVIGKNNYSRKTLGNYGNYTFLADITKMREIAMLGNTAAIKWLKDESKKDSQLKHSDVTGQMIFDAAKIVMSDMELDIPETNSEDPVVCLDEIMEKLYSKYCENSEIADEVKIMTALIANAIQFYNLKTEAERHFQIEHTMRKSLGIPHKL